MNESEMIRRQVQVVLNEIQFLTRLLYGVSDGPTRNLILQELWRQTSFLHFLIDLTEREYPSIPGPSPAPAGELPSVTQAQLVAATGRAGNPAWIAVNGVVYDVTNNAAWSAATHFGLNAGRDLTAEFASCHAERPGILNTLMPVGRLT